MEDDSNKSNWNISSARMEHIAYLIHLGNQYQLGNHYQGTEDRPSGQADNVMAFRCYKLIAQEIQAQLKPDELHKLQELRKVAIDKARVNNPDFVIYKHAPKFKVGNESLGRTMEGYIFYVNKLLKKHGMDVTTSDPRRAYL